MQSILIEMLSFVALYLPNSCKNTTKNECYMTQKNNNN